jgi:hypothetical protein
MSLHKQEDWPHKRKSHQNHHCCGGTEPKSKQLAFRVEGEKQRHVWMLQRRHASLSVILQSADSCQQCDGQRSSCQRCVEKGSACVYDTEPGLSRLASLRRKLNALQTEINQLHGVIEYIRTCPDMDASEAFRQIRASKKPLDVAKSLSAALAL